MAAGIPPPPLNSPSGSYYWLEWYTTLTNYLNGTNIPWSNLNFTGSAISDIQTRPHNALTSIQGGNASGTANPTGYAYHLIGYGYVKGDGTSYAVPTGWTVARTGTGTYNITHNQGLLLPDYVCGGTAMTPGAIVGYVSPATSNTITVFTFSTSSLTTSADADFSFWIGKV